MTYGVILLNFGVVIITLSKINIFGISEYIEFILKMCLWVVAICLLPTMRGEFRRIKAKQYS